MCIIYTNRVQFISKLNKVQPFDILFIFLGVMECIMFETEDLVCRKNEKHVVLTLLEVARRGAKIGMLAPMLVQFEQEIDLSLIHISEPTRPY